jgi:hypothetical protein
VCINAILSLFRKKTQPSPSEPPQQLVIPHPEEPPDYSITMSNYNIDAVFNKWMIEYNIPQENHDYWRNAIEIQIDDTLGFPAATWDNPSTGKRHLSVKPEWLNTGVLAHEQAHNSYALLTDNQKNEFSSTYTPLKTGNQLIAYLYSKNPYGLSSDIEGHAEVFRYISEKMPEQLKQFYPKLI